MTMPRVRFLCEIAQDIERNWRPVTNKGAAKALAEMKTMMSIEDSYGCESSGRSVVQQFLAHDTGWSGETARRIKAELDAMLKRPSSRS